MAAAPTTTGALNLETAILTEVVTRFVTLGESTLRRLILIKFEGHSASQAIANLISQNFLVRASTSSEEAYLPTAAAFNFSGDGELRNQAKFATTIVLHTLKQMFKGEQKKEGFGFDDLKRHVEKIYPTRSFDRATLKLGLYLAKDFGVLGGTRLNSPEDTEVTWFQVGEGAIGMADPEDEWERIMSQYSLPRLPSKGAPPSPSVARQERWERMKSLGSGGQSDAFLVRSPERSHERAKCVERIQTALRGLNSTELADAAWSYSRPESASELGALKLFKIPEEGAVLNPDQTEAVERLKNEIAVLRESRKGLPKLLDSNVKERWIVTEYFPEGTLEANALKFRGNVVPALKAFRSLVESVALLHEAGYVHRDIKPPNVFVRNSELVLGDFGIVYLPTDKRLTHMEERVGPRDYMPPWAHRGKRVDQVEPSWDVYMLAKLLWCMLDGRSFLPREDYDDPDFDLSRTFPNDRNMQVVNGMLAKCLVKKPETCIRSGQQLLAMLDDCLATIERGLPLLNDQGTLAVPCRVCGKGYYKETHGGTYSLLAVYDSRNVHSGSIRLRLFTCDVCNHYEFFAPGFPDEAAKRGWRQ